MNNNHSNGFFGERSEQRKMIYNSGRYSLEVDLLKDLHNWAHDVLIEMGLWKSGQRIHLSCKRVYSWK